MTLMYKLNPRTYTYTVMGGGGWVLICCYIWKRFCLKWRAFDLLYKMKSILLVVEVLEACDVTEHGRHLSRHLGFCQELRIR